MSGKGSPFYLPSGLPIPVAEPDGLSAPYWDGLASEPAPGAALQPLPDLAIRPGMALSSLSCLRSRVDRGRAVRPHLQLGAHLASLASGTQAARSLRRRACGTAARWRRAHGRQSRWAIRCRWSRLATRSTACSSITPSPIRYFRCCSGGRDDREVASASTRVKAPIRRWGQAGARSLPLRISVGMHHQTLLNECCEHRSVPIVHARDRQATSFCCARTFSLDVHPFIWGKCAMKPDAMVEARNVQWFARSQLEEMAPGATEVEPPIRQIRKWSNTRRPSLT